MGAKCYNGPMKRSTDVAIAKEMLDRFDASPGTTNWERARKIVRAIGKRMRARARKRTAKK